MRHVRNVWRDSRDGGQSDRGMGLADYLGWDWKSVADLPIVNVPGCPVQPDNFMETLLYLLYQVAGLGAHDPARRSVAADVAVRRDGARGMRPRRLLRAGRLRGGVWLAEVHREIGLLGAGGELQRPEARLDGRHRRMPERWRHLHRLHDAGIPGQVHAVHGRAAWREGLGRTIGLYGAAIRALRSFTNDTVNKEPKWRHPRAELRLAIARDAF